MPLDVLKARHVRNALEAQLPVLERMTPEERMQKPFSEFAAFYDKLRDAAQLAMREVAPYRWPPKASFAGFGNQQAVGCNYIELTAYMRQLVSVIAGELDEPKPPE